jgi:hypothetical protein
VHYRREGHPSKLGALVVKEVGCSNMNL